ncbi:hypothetical protein BH10PSE2_BH10PSE2_19430 [soil metagenome]
MTGGRADLRPAIVICAYDLDEAGQNPVTWDAVEDLSGQAWSPAGARTVAVAAAAPEELALTLSSRLRDADCRAVLLVGRTRRSDRFRIQMRADNRALHGEERARPTGPATARVTAPVADMVRALTAAGLRADASSDGEEDVGSYLLYSILSALPDDQDAPAVGLLRAPIDVDDTALRRGVKAAADAIARTLSPLPRPRPT